MTLVLKTQLIEQGIQTYNYLLEISDSEPMFEKVNKPLKLGKLNTENLDKFSCKKLNDFPQQCQDTILKLAEESFHDEYVIPYLISYTIIFLVVQCLPS